MASDWQVHFLLFFLLFATDFSGLACGWSPDSKCNYQFHIWHPQDDFMQKIHDLDIKWTNVSGYIDREFLHLKNDALLELKQCQNWTSRLERDISGLKLQEVKGRIKQRDLNSGISNFQHQLDELNKRISHIQRKFSKMSRKYSVDEMVQKAMPLTERNGDIDVAEILQDSVGDMKAEWLLMKRDLIDLMNQISSIKSEQTSLLKQSIDLSLSIRNLTQRTPTNATIRELVLEETKALQTNVDSLGHDLTELKNRETNMAKDVLSIQESLKDILVKSDNMKKKFGILTTDNAYLKNLVLSVTKSKNLGSNVNVGGAVDVTLGERGIVASDCQDIYNIGHRTSGVYQIKPKGAQQADDVYCEFVNQTAYTVFQRRTDGLLRFDRLWLEYKYGFGNLYGEHWLGNEIIHLLSVQRKYILHIDLWDWEGKRFFAEYHIFKLDGDEEKYRLHVSEYNGNAGDSLGNHNEMKFSTEDMDNDLTSRSCATDNKGGWWFNNCFVSNLNGVYHVGYYSHAQSSFSDGVVWYTLKDSDVYSLRKSEMKIRRLE